MATKLSKEAIQVLRNAELVKDPPSNRWEMYLNNELERSLYTEVIDALKRVDGKWSRKDKAILFPMSQPIDFLVQTMIETGKKPEKNPLQLFETPENVAETMLDIAADEKPESVSGDPKIRILEPSAGRGALLSSIQDTKSTVVAVEIDKMNCDILRSRFDFDQDNWYLYNTNTLHWSCASVHPFDLVLMNPPFKADKSPHVYTKHILSALERLNDDGLLVSVVPAGLSFNKHKEVARLKEIVDTYGGSMDLERGAFKESGTMVNASVIWIHKWYEYTGVGERKKTWSDE